jgi:hypothetical protein
MATLTRGSVDENRVFDLHRNDPAGTAAMRVVRRGPSRTASGQTFGQADLGAKPRRVPEIFDQTAQRSESAPSAAQKIPILQLIEHTVPIKGSLLAVPTGNSSRARTTRNSKAGNSKIGTSVVRGGRWTAFKPGPNCGFVRGIVESQSERRTMQNPQKRVSAYRRSQTRRMQGRERQR